MKKTEKRIVLANAKMCIRDSPKTDRAKQFLNTFEFHEAKTHVK